MLTALRAVGQAVVSSGTAESMKMFFIPRIRHPVLHPLSKKKSSGSAFFFSGNCFRGDVDEPGVFVVVDTFRESLNVGLHEINFVGRLHRNAELDCHLASLGSHG